MTTRATTTLFTCILATPAMLAAQQATPAATELAKSQLAAGQQALSENRLEDAARFFQEAIQDDHDLTAAYCALGQTFLRLRQYGAAVESLSACKARASDEIEQARAAAFEGDRQRDDEIRELKDSLRRIQSRQVQLAARHATEVRIENRIRELENQRFKDRLAATVPPETSFALGTALLHTGAFTAAERELLEALRARPSYPEAHNNPAATYVAMGRWDDAAEQARLAEAGGFAVSGQLKADIQARHASVTFERPPVQVEPPRPPAPQGGAVQIEHEPLACARADAFPTVTATFEGEDVARARVKFRSGKDGPWYSVLMFPDRQGRYSAVLPKPKSDLETFTYVVVATDRDLHEFATGEYSVVVVGEGESCDDGRLAAIAVSPPLIALEVPEGKRAGPDGFSGKNVLATYPSGRVVKGRPSTALLAVAGAGAVAGGLSLLKSEPVGSSVPSPWSAYVRLAGSSPGPGSTISLSRGSLSMMFEVYAPTSVPAGGELTVELHEGLAALVG